MKVIYFGTEGVGANDLNMLKNMEIIYIAFILEYVVLDIEKKIHGPNPDR